jgi:hypothetical protein
LFLKVSGFGIIDIVNFEIEVLDLLEIILNYNGSRELGILVVATKDGAKGGGSEYKKKKRKKKRTHRIISVRPTSDHTLVAGFLS